MVLKTRATSGPFGIGVELPLLAALGVGHDDLGRVGGRGEVAHDRVHERPDADVLRAAADQHGRHQARCGRPCGGRPSSSSDVISSPSRYLVMTSSSASDGGLDQLVAAGRDLGREVGRDRDLGLLAALRACHALPWIDVHEAGEAVRRADRHLERRDLLAERGAQLVDRGAGVARSRGRTCSRRTARAVVPAGDGHGQFEARLDVARGVHEDDRGVGRGEALDDLGDEVGVAGGVDQLDARAPRARARRPRCSATGAASAPRARSRGWRIPSSTRPRREIAPASKSSRSASVVLPAPACPARTTLRRWGRSTLLVAICPMNSLVALESALGAAWRRLAAVRP